jgi:hypothetical protein
MPGVEQDLVAEEILVQDPESDRFRADHGLKARGIDFVFRPEG